MVKLIDTKTSEEIKESGYYRLFKVNNRKYDMNVSEFVARIPQMAQAAVIRNGDELEHMLTYEKYHNDNIELIGKKNGKKTIHREKYKITPLNVKKRIFFNPDKTTWIFNPNISKELFTKYKINISKKHLEPDVIIIDNNIIYIVELKDGGNFDTKKSEGEGKQLQILEKLFTLISKDMGLDTKVESELVVWNIHDMKKASIKDKVARSYALIGPDFAKKHNVNINRLDIDRLKLNVSNIMQMREWFEEAIERMDRYEKYLNPKGKSLSLTKKKDKKRIQKYSSSIKKKINNKRNKALKQHNEVLAKEQIKIKKKNNKIKKEKNFIKQWPINKINKSEDGRVMNPDNKRLIRITTATYTKLEKKYIKLSKKYNQ